MISLEQIDEFPKIVDFRNNYRLYNYYVTAANIVLKYIFWFTSAEHLDVINYADITRPHIFDIALLGLRKLAKTKWRSPFTSRLDSRSSILLCKI